MRRRLVPMLSASALASALALAGCGSGGSAGSAAGSGAASAKSAPASPTAAGSEAELPTVAGSVGAKPEVKAPASAPGSTLVAEVLSEGKGPVVNKGDLLVANYVGQTWRANKVFDNSYDRRAPASFPIGVGSVISGWDEGLVGRKAGSRVLLVLPPDKGYGSSGQPDAGIQGDDTLVFVVDVLGSFSADDAATGRPLPVPADLPQVSAQTGEGGAAAKPKIRIPEGKKPPAKLRTAVVVQGSGQPVRKGQLLVAQYVGLTWRESREFDSSWNSGQPAGFPIGVGRVIKGWDEALVGVKTGSRVLLVVPPDKGYGAAGQPEAGIRADDTLVFVVDVLAAY